VDVYFFPKMLSFVTEMHIHVTPYFGLCSKLQWDDVDGLII
jgi:hypothetical protein